MAISVVQSTAFTGAWSGSFTGNVTADSTVFLVAFQYNGADPAMSSSNPLFNGSPVAGASRVLEGQFPAPGGASGVYGTVWMLPNLAGGAASVMLTNSGGTVDGNVGMTAIEVAGLGASPAVDAAAAPNPSINGGFGTGETSGATGALTLSPEFVVALSVAYGGPQSNAGAPWTELPANASFWNAGWQVVTSPGSTFAYSPGNSGANWFAGIVAVAAASAPATPPPIAYRMRSS